MVHKINHIAFYFAAWILALHVHAQPVDIAGNFRDAEYYLFEKRYEQALPFYLRLYQADSNNYTIHYRIGECYFHMPREQEKAIPYLEKASEKVSRRFVNEKYEQNIAHINTFFMLGQLYHKQEQLGKAFYNYQKYKEMLRSGEKEELEKTGQYIQSVYVAWELQQKYVPYSAMSLGDEINTRHSDYNPVLSVNQDVMAYTSFWETTDVILFTWKENGQWRKPYNITEMIGSHGDCYTSAIAPDGKTLYLVKQDFYNSDFYYTTYEDNKWQSIKKMSNRINSSDQETSLFISDDGQTLLFSSNRSGGHGGLDIYISRAEGRGKWSKPENIGPVINTPFDEEAPFLADNGNLLFFSSKGHHTMGGYDIFYSRKNEDGTWSEPVNVGYPINTTRDDLFYVPFGEGNTGYFVRDLPGGNGLMDIYQVEVPKELLFQNKLADFDEKLQAGYYEEVFAAYKDDPGTDTSDSNLVEMVHAEPEKSMGTQRIVSSSGAISHVIPSVDTDQATSEAMVQSDTIDTGREHSNAGRTAQDAAGTKDFIHFEAGTDGTIAPAPDAVVAVTGGAQPGVNPDSPNQPVEHSGHTGEPGHISNIDADKEPVRSRRPEEFKTSAPSSGTRAVGIPLYTVQIIALLKPVDASYYGQLEELTISAGDDGFTRYTIGEYRGYKQAQKALRKIRSQGFPNAFIREVGTISNYKKNF